MNITVLYNILRIQATNDTTLQSVRGSQSSELKNILKLQPFLFTIKLLDGINIKTIY